MIVHFKDGPELRKIGLVITSKYLSVEVSDGVLLKELKLKSGDISPQSLSICTETQSDVKKQRHFLFWRVNHMFYLLYIEPLILKNRD